MATSFVAGNWKMNTTLEEAVALARELRVSLATVDGVTRVVCPPFISIAAVAGELEGSAIEVGAQNMHPEPKGAFTGEVAGAMLRGLCRYVIVGHSERRALFGESDEFVNRKVRAALDLGLTPILCVGETLEQRDAGQAEGVVRRQLDGGLSGLSGQQVASVVIAYEPVWAIGTGRAATPDIAQEMMGMIRNIVAAQAGGDAGEMPLLYGGSVNAKNAADLAAQRDIDGALVGGASLQAGEFADIVRAFAQTQTGRLGGSLPAAKG